MSMSEIGQSMSRMSTGVKFETHNKIHAYSFRMHLLPKIALYATPVPQFALLLTPAISPATDVPWISDGPGKGSKSLSQKSREKSESCAKETIVYHMWQGFIQDKVLRGSSMLRVGRWVCYTCPSMI